MPNFRGLFRKLKKKLVGLFENYYPAQSSQEVRAKIALLKPKKRKKNQIITRDDEIVESMFEPPLDTIIEEDSENPENNPEVPENPENNPENPENNPENPENNPENPENRKKRKKPFNESEDSDSDTDGEFDESCEEQINEQTDYSDMEVEENRIEE